MSNKLPTEERIKRLPDWVQQEIAWRDRRIEEMKQSRIESITKDETDTFIHDLSQGLKIPLPKRALIQFQYGPDWDQHITAQLTYPGGPNWKDQRIKLEIRAVGGRMVVQPDCGNCVLIIPEDR